jgi:hypothetical protein
MLGGVDNAGPWNADIGPTTCTISLLRIYLTSTVAQRSRQTDDFLVMDSLISFPADSPMPYAHAYFDYTCSVGLVPSLPIVLLNANCNQSYVPLSALPFERQ